MVKITSQLRGIFRCLQWKFPAGSCNSIFNISRVIQLRTGHKMAAAGAGSAGPGAGRRDSTDESASDGNNVTITEESVIQGVKLSPEEVAIYRAHEAAMERGESTYVDPKTGYTVFTEKTHLDRGQCCGNACRHCPYGHVKAPDHLRQMKKFNSFFYF